MNKKADKPTQGHAKKAGLNSTPRFFKESKVDKVEDVELGSPVNVEEILGAGDIVDVSGTSKGKGFAGGVKRHHFKGGPKTHGQSDRHRAPGSIGQSTTPGRVYKGKRMAGHMGVDQKTVKNLEVIDLTDGILLVKGLVPGHISSIVTITKRGVNKKAMGLYKEVVEEEILENAKVEEIGPSVEEQEEMRKETEAKAEEAEKAEAAEAQVANQVDKPEVEVTATEEVVSEPVEAVAEETPEIIAEETKEEEEAK
jgi:large subunit ribosomal protein L3